MKSSSKMSRESIRNSKNKSQKRRRGSEWSDKKYNTQRKMVKVEEIDMTIHMEVSVVVVTITEEETMVVEVTIGVAEATIIMDVDIMMVTQMIVKTTIEVVTIEEVIQPTSSIKAISLNSNSNNKFNSSNSR